MGSVVKTKKKTKAGWRGRGTSLVLASGNFIKEWRELAGYATQGDLAKASGVNRSVISRLESGKLTYRGDLLEPLAATLECSPWELLAVDPTKIASIVQIEARLKALKVRCARK